MRLIDLNYNYECDSLTELSDNNLASDLVENRSFFKPMTESVYLIINITELSQTFVSLLRWRYLAQPTEMAATINKTKKNKPISYGRREVCTEKYLAKVLIRSEAVGQGSFQRQRKIFFLILGDQSQQMTFFPFFSFNKTANMNMKRFWNREIICIVNQPKKGQRIPKSVIKRFFFLFLSIFFNFFVYFSLICFV